MIVFHESLGFYLQFISTSNLLYYSFQIMEKWHEVDIYLSSNVWKTAVIKSIEPCSVFLFILYMLIG